MSDRCIGYVIDKGYLLQALVSAIQARVSLPREAGDVAIVCIDDQVDDVRGLVPVAEAHGVQLVLQRRSAIDHAHVMFGRFFLHKMLPKRYRRIAYIDGDTQIRGSLEPILSVDIPKGCFLAARDPTALYAKLSRKWFKRVMEERAEAGYTRPYGDYFNSGVLVFDTDSWEDLSGACIDLLRSGGDRWRYPDQDILNRAVGEQCRLISIRWNFPGFLIGSREEQLVQPVVYHFMSNPRPWNQAVPPWGSRWGRPYAELVKRHPELQPFAPHATTSEKARYWAQQHLKMASEYHALGQLRELEPDISV